MKSELRIPFFLIFRHLRRGNKWTLLLIIFLMSVAFVNLVFVTSLFNGIIDSSNQQIINTSTGHILITPEEDKDLLEDAGGLLREVRRVEGVKAASYQMAVPASLEHMNIKRSRLVYAINPGDEKKVTIVSRKMIKGSYLSPGDTDRIIIGRQLAGSKGVSEDATSFRDARVGDTITLSIDRFKKDFKIKGIFYVKFVETDERAYITQKALEGLGAYYKDKGTSITVRIKQTGDEKKVIAAMRSLGLKGTFHAWKDMAGMMKMVTKSFLSINVILSFVGALIAAVTIFIVIYIDISDKRQQIGILRAIGIKPYLIRSVYVLQTVLYSVSGVLLGSAILFGVIVPYFKARPFELPIGDATLLINYADFIIRAESMILVAIFSGLIPAILVTRMKMLDEIQGRW